MQKNVVNSIYSLPAGSGETFLEISSTELNSLLDTLALTYNQFIKLIMDAGVMTPREVRRSTEQHAAIMKQEDSIMARIHLILAWIRQGITKMQAAQKALPKERIKSIVQVCTKVMRRAMAIVEHIRQSSECGAKDVTMDSHDARILFSGSSTEIVSRRDTIRAIHKAKSLWPALEIGYRPNDGRNTMRIVFRKESMIVSHGNDCFSEY